MTHENANIKLLDIGYKITSQKDFMTILQTILVGAKELSSSDGGTLYLFDEKKQQLCFQIVSNDTLDIHNNARDWEPLSLYTPDGSPNLKNIASVSALEGRLINIEDVYASDAFDFSGVKAFDALNNYQTQSMLVLPMKNRDNMLIGLIQLINKKDSQNQICSFSDYDEVLIKAMASLATMTIENNKLVLESEGLLYALIDSINQALGAKSKYTQEHNTNVALLTDLIAAAITKNTTHYKNVTFSDVEMEELQLASLLHDIGKVVTPAHIMDKASKLESIYDRIALIRLRFELAQKDILLAYANKEIDFIEKEQKIKQYQEDLLLVEQLNDGEYFASQEQYNRLEAIAIDSEYSLISEDELYHLSTRKGTLTAQEREIINNHVLISYDMIKDLPFPKKFANVPVIACSHHKTIDGGGYAAAQIKNLELTLKDKILVIADIFEALSSKDRPYKKANTLKQIFTIFTYLIKDNKLDRALVQMFFEDGVYLQYAKKHLKKEQYEEDITADITAFFHPSTEEAFCL